VDEDTVVTIVVVVVTEVPDETVVVVVTLVVVMVVVGRVVVWTVVVLWVVLDVVGVVTVVRVVTVEVEVTELVEPVDDEMLVPPVVADEVRLEAYVVDCVVPIEPVEPVVLVALEVDAMFESVEIVRVVGDTLLPGAVWAKITTASMRTRTTGSAPTANGRIRSEPEEYLFLMSPFSENAFPSRH
jgi:hypothetical protein